MVISSFPPAYSGASQALIRLGRGLIPLGWKVEVVCALPDGSPEHEMYEGLEVHRLPCGSYRDLEDVPPFPVQGRFALACAGYIWSNRRRIHLVHFHGVGRTTIPGLFAARCAGLATVGKVSGIEHDAPSAHLRRPFGKTLLRLLAAIDLFVAVSPRIGRDIEEAGCWSRSPVLHLPNPVDAGRYTPAFLQEKTRIRQTLGVSPDEFVFLFVGVLSRAKGGDALVEAWNRICRGCGIRGRLVAVGLPGEKEILADFQALPRATFAGRKSAREVVDYYRMADCLVLPTRGEGLPNVVLEAMACALPCIAGRLDGITDYLLGDGRGLLIDPEAVGTLAEAMEKVMMDPDWARHAGAKARGWVLEQADTSGIARKYHAAYLSLLAKVALQPGGSEATPQAQEAQADEH